jgi:hypothetical protein
LGDDAGEQHEGDDNQQGDQRPLELLAQSRRTVGNRLELEGIVQELWLREHRHRRGAHLRLHRAQRRGRRLELSPRFHPQHDVHPGDVVVECDARENLWLGPDREDHVEGSPDFDAEKARRRNADDRDRDALHGHGRADAADGAAEALLPQPVADHRGQPVRSAAR